MEKLEVEKGHDHLFSESEVGDLVRRAAELQEAGSVEGYVPGVTKNELQKMILEAGIDPIYLEKAIQERLVPPGSRKKFRWIEEVERVMPVEVNPTDYDLIFDSVRVVPSQSTGHGLSSGITQVGRSIQGQIQAKFDHPTFKIASRGGRTKLTVRSTNMAAVVFGALGLPFLLLAPLISGIFMGPLAAWLSVPVMLTLIISAIVYAVRKGHQSTHEVANSLEMAILAAGKPSTLESIVE